MKNIFESAGLAKNAGSESGSMPIGIGAKGVQTKKIFLKTCALNLGYNEIRSIDKIHEVVEKVMYSSVDNLMWLDL
jgi:hypothetical protein